MELTVEAAVTGDRHLVLQAMLLDPVVDSVSAAERVLDEMMQAQPHPSNHRVRNMA
jgi:alpha-galactosidase/6-phospho-beta-glucosidase family protein